MTTMPAPPKPLEVQRGDNKIFSHIRRTWLVETPEERIRQAYLCVLVNDYGYCLEQIDEERPVTGRGTGQARADFLIWRTAEEKAQDGKPFIVVECKSDNVTITDRDYRQGENYARIVDATFFVTHNSRETKYWRVLKDKMPGYVEEIANIPLAGADDRRIAELVDTQKTFNAKDFARLLHDCHNIIRNREHLDPAAAFDEIAKILFVKVDQERRLRGGHAKKNLFTEKFIREQRQYYTNPVKNLFEQTKEDFAGDKIFHKDEQINLRENTALEIVRLLERYNLSDTSEDIKGIAFERFLGRTFRGEIGQFFTPRSIVDFMIQMLEPREGDVICDPASGSGGFLIRFFEIVREQILADADREYRAYAATVEASDVAAEEKASRLVARYDAIQQTLDQRRHGSRLWALANRCIYGTDANDRMARTSKMNMIMHGDGHGGVHHHNGFLNVNGIFEGRFDVILTNPPFGSNVEATDVVREEDVRVDEELRRRYTDIYGDLYREAQARVEAKRNRPLLELFSLPKGLGGKVKTEILFIERCLSLLKPGGRLGIVLPEGIFNNPSLAYVREFCEDRAYLRAVVSLPQETFYSSGASVKASLLFLQKFTESEQADFDAQRRAAQAETEEAHRPAREAETARLTAAVAAARSDKDALAVARKALRDYERRLSERIAAETRALLKERFPYPVFLYEAERVGITATGEDDLNELYPNERQPSGGEQTCLELYRAFRHDSNAFLLAGGAA